MVLNRPKIQRVYVTVSDPDQESPSKTITVYGATPEQVIQKFIAILGESLKEGSATASEAAERNSASPGTAGAAGRPKRTKVAVS